MSDSDETATGASRVGASRVILVTGATGQQGGAVARRLLADGWRVRALTRDPASAAARGLVGAGAEVVAGDLDDRGSLDAAAAGVHGVFSVQRGALGVPPLAFEDEVRQGRAVVDAAVAARVHHLVQSSVARVEEGGGGRAFASKRAIEEHIARVGAAATILRPVSFMENYADPAFGVQTGVLATPFALDIPEQLVAVDDIGAVAALAFADPASYQGQTVAIAGDALRPEQTARALGRAAGRDIVCTQIPIEAVRRVSSGAADVADFLNGRGGYGVDIAAARARQPGLMTFETWLAGPGRAKLARLFATPA